jgi:hypothetical protein
MKYALTRTRAGKNIGNDVGTTNSTVMLRMTDLNRAESEFYYEALWDFLNRSEKRKEQYFDKISSQQMWERSNAPELCLLQQFRVRLDRLTKMPDTEKKQLLKIVDEIVEAMKD